MRHGRRGGPRLSRRSTARGRSSTIDRQRPSLGAKLAGHWRAWIDRAVAAGLERYIDDKPKADDTGAAYQLLLRLYVRGDQPRWRRLPPEVEKRLQRVAERLLESDATSGLRPHALVVRAMVKFSRALGGAGGPTRRALRGVRRDLDAVLAEHPESDARVDALTGLVRVAAADGDVDEARAQFARLDEALADDDAGRDQVERDLGQLLVRVRGLPAFEAATLDGAALSPAELRGRVVVLDFWATWCGPCKAELPHLRKLHEKFGGRGLDLVGISLDDDEDMSREEFVA